MAEDLMEYRDRCLAQIEQLKEMREPLVSGKIRSATRQAGDAEWTDTTQDRIDHLSEVISTYEGIVARLSDQITSAAR